MKSTQLLSVLCLTTLITTSIFCSDDVASTAAPEIYPPVTVTQPNGEELTLETTPAPTQTSTDTASVKTETTETTEVPSVVNKAAASIQEEVTKAGCFATALVSLKEQGSKLTTYVGTSRIGQFVQNNPKTSSALVATVVAAGIAWYYQDAIKNWFNKRQASKA